MLFGIAFANSGPFAEGPGAVASARAAEDNGFDSLWAVEHVLVPADYESTYPYARSGRMPGGDAVPIPDPLIWLSYVAAATSTIKLGTGILILPQRNPAVAAKEVASLDRLSGGRVLLGVGVGWLEEEFDALGVPFAGRGKRMEAYVAAMRALWTGEEVDLDDGYHRWERAISQPTPAGDTVPIVVGGHSEVAARRAGRIGDGFFPGKGKPDQIAHLIGVMRKAAEEAGRDPESIEVTAGAPSMREDPLGAVAEMAEIGVHRIMVPPLSLDPATVADAYGMFRDRIIDRL
jgi:probable F420-dependent oxidoreductase